MKNQIKAFIDQLPPEYEEFRKIVVKLQVQLDRHRWIPVKEKSPNKDGYYQVIRKQNTFPTTREYCNQGWCTTDTVIYWKEILLPEGR